VSCQPGTTHAWLLLPASFNSAALLTKLPLSRRAAAAKVITGKGLHSQGDPKLKPAIRRFLEDRGWSFRELPGLFEVYFDERYAP